MQHRVLSVGSGLAHADFRGAAQHSFDVQPCATLSLALDRAARASFECILVSSHLPDAPGTEAVQRLRRECGDTPLLFVSDTPDVDFREWGADEVFTSHEVGTRLFARSLLYAIEQRRVRVQHRQLERLLETIPDAILVTNRRGKVRYVNPAALELFGCARLDLEEELLAFAAKDREPFEINVLRKGDIR
ncbi:MAG TPA: PAS domain-containing protein, partial [Polyangiaceae bacterium]|nr:PAS domain-containing protein [Polyangiaceae bacterium]